MCAGNLVALSFLNGRVSELRVCMLLCVIFPAVKAPAADSIQQPHCVCVQVCARLPPSLCLSHQFSHLRPCFHQHTLALFCRWFRFFCDFDHYVSKMPCVVAQLHFFKMRIFVFVWFVCGFSVCLYNQSVCHYNTSIARRPPIKLFPLWSSGAGSLALSKLGAIA